MTNLRKVSFSKNEIWGVFLQTFTGESNLEVTNIENDSITFKLSPEIALNLFKDKEEIQRKVVFAASNKDQVSPYLHLDGQSLINELVDQNFLKELKLNFDNKNCQDDINAKVMSCNIKENNIFQFKQSLNSYKVLQSLLQSEEQVSNIMLGNSKVLREDNFNDQKSEYGEKIISIVSNIEDKLVDVSINYGEIIQSTELAKYKQPDLIPSDVNSNEFIVNKKTLLGYAQNIIPSGIIYAQTSEGTFQPILFQSLKADKPNIFQNTNFAFILDVSYSMRNDIKAIKNILSEFIEKITLNTKNWTISIKPFSDYLYETKSFNSGDSLKLINDYIISIKSDGATALYSAMEDIYAQEIISSSKTTNTVVFTITDGANNAGQSSDEGIIALAKDLRSISPQSAMYNIGYASYSQKFFEDLSKSTAAKTVHLDNINDLEELYQDIDTMNNCKVLYEFASGEYSQCAAGDVYIPSFTIDAQNSDIKIGGETYEMSFNN